MTLFVSALNSEAKPLIELFKLSLVKDSNFKIFENNKLVLIISGIGSINAAIATTYAINKFDITNTVNIGICGSFDKSVNTGDIFDIKKVINYQTHKVYHLKNLKRVAPAKTLYSFENPQNSPILKNSLADMESIGFFLSAREFIDPKNIYILKVVSDYIDDKILTNKKVSSLIKKHNDLYIKILHEL